MIFSLIISFLFNAGSPALVTDYNNALTLAKQEDKNILMIFAGSDWCRPCKRFKSTILEQREFQEWAEEELILLYLDFPLKGKISEHTKTQNKYLANKFNKSGLIPQLILVDKDEKVIKSIKFNDQSVEEFITLCGKMEKSKSFSSVE